MTKTRAAKLPASDEVVAANAVTAVRSADLGVPLIWDHADTGAADKTHDFWLIGKGVREALEVTTLADQQTKTDLAHWQKKGPGKIHTYSGLRWSWTIMVDPTENRTALERGLAGWLRALEAEGIRETGRWYSERIYTHPVTNAMAAAGVMIASAVTRSAAGTVWFVYATNNHPRLAGDPNHITDTVTQALTLPRHIADAGKLAASGAAVRHLFLWVDPLTRLDLGRALADGLPSQVPIVDARITDVWLGLPDGSDVDVLRWSDSEGWRHVFVTGAAGTRV